MSVFHNNALIGSGGGVAADVDANITKSLRFNRGDSPHLIRTPSSAGNRRTFTISFWVKRTGFGTDQSIFSTGTSASLSGNTNIKFETDNAFRVVPFDLSGSGHELKTEAVFRDPASFFHCVIAYDTTQATAANRGKIYINGVEAALSVANYPSQNAELGVNSNIAQVIGRYNYATTNYLDAYVADFYLIDGSQLDPTSFGAFDDNGVWQATGYSGTYGTNGFHLLDFANEATIGHDSSGNENDFTANNLNTGGTPAVITGSASPSGNSGFQASYPGSYALDGSDTSQAAANYSAGDTTTVTVTFNPAITAGSTLTAKIYQYQTYHSMKVNSGSFVTASSSVVNLLSGHGVSAGDSISSITYKTVSPNSAFALGNELYYIKNGGTNIVSTPTQNDVLFDAPQNDTTNTDSGAGGEISGCYCTLNPLIDRYNIGSSGTKTFSEGNLKIVATTGDSTRSRYLFGTIGVSSGKWYYEMTADNTAGGIGVGFAPRQFADEDGSISVRYNSSGSIRIDGTTHGSLASYSAGDIVGVGLDLDNNTVQFYKNGSTVGSAYTVTSGYTYLPFILIPSTGTSSTGATFNFGQRVFAYSAPSNFKCLNTASLPTPTVSDGSAHFDTKLWTGTGSARSITMDNSSMSPDFVWIKARNASYNHYLYDTIRGATKELYSNTYGPEQIDADNLTSFDSNGFGLGPDAGVNQSTKTYVGWVWNMGANSNKTYTVKVVSDSGNKYRFDDHGTSAVTLDLAEGSTYIFDQSDSSNSGHPLRFSTTSNGSHGGGSEYTTGVTVTGTPGSAGAKTTIVVAASAPTLYYYCTAHSGMGGQINTNSTEGSTRLSGEFNSSVYNQSQNWSSNFSSSNGFATSAANAFDGSTSTEAYASSNGGVLTMTFSPSLSGEIEMDIPNGGTFKNSSTDAAIGSFSGRTWTYTASNLPGIKIEQTGGRPNPTRVKLDGKILIDSTATPAAVPATSSVVKVNQETGMSIVSWVGTGSLTTVGHGLNAVPHFMAVKNRNSSGNTNWCVYHVGLTSAAYTLGFDSSYFEDPNDPTWGSTAPTSSVFTVKTRASANESGKNMIGYIFTPVPGFSSFGKYTANGSSDGPYIDTGFAVAWLLTKRINSSASWEIHDLRRPGYNPQDGRLFPDSTAQDGTGNNVDLLSNGFKIRNSFTGMNGSSGDRYVYAAFARNPFAANGGLAR